MIFILAEETDVSSDLVVEWLLHWNTPHRVMNSSWDAIDKIEFKEDGQIHLVFNNGLSLEDIDVVWFRRGYLLFGGKVEVAYPGIQRVIDNHLMEEVDTLKRCVYALLKTKPSINHPLVYNASKLVVLQKAMAHGLKVPPTLITKQLDQVKRYKRQQKTIISKNIQDVLSIPLYNQRAGNSTKIVQQEHLERADATFFYSLFQKAIDKRYELRVFYLNGTCYGCAIFSQLSHRTKEDNRLEDHTKPNRVVPYQLPPHLEQQVKALMEDLSMESGSLDFIVDHQLDYYFLEVNPSDNSIMSVSGATIT